MRTLPHPCVSVREKRQDTASVKTGVIVKVLLSFCQILSVDSSPSIPLQSFTASKRSKIKRGSKDQSMWPFACPDHQSIRRKDLMIGKPARVTSLPFTRYMWDFASEFQLDKLIPAAIFRFEMEFKNKKHWRMNGISKLFLASVLHFVCVCVCFCSLKGPWFLFLLLSVLRGVVLWLCCCRCFCS